MAKPSGVYASAAEWVQADAAWQRAYFAEHGKRPRLDAPLRRFFTSDEDHQDATANRLMLCGYPDHEGDRLLTREQVHKNKLCKACVNRKQNAYRTARLPEQVVYETAEDFMQEHARMEDGTRKYCRMPKADEFRSPDVFAAAVDLRNAWNREFHREYNRDHRDRGNELARNKYAERKETVEGREALASKMERDQENKKARLHAPLAEGMDRCPVGPHDVPAEEMIFCPVADLGLVDYKGVLGRQRRGHCREHFHKALGRNRRHNVKPARKLYNANREQFTWVKLKRKEWKDVNRKRYNEVRRAFFKANPQKAAERARKSAVYQSIPENAQHLRAHTTKWTAQKQGLSYELNDEDERYWFSPARRCYFCGVAAKGVRPLGVNRIDHSNPRIANDTVVSACKLCVFSRGRMSIDAFRQACLHIVRYRDDGMENTVAMPFLIGQRTLTKGVTFHSLLTRAHKRNIVVELTMEQHNHLRFSQCYLCGLRATYPTVPLGIDRMDNCQGYTVANSLACCTCCNMMKKQCTMDDFVARCRRIASGNNHAASSSTSVA